MRVAVVIALVLAAASVAEAAAVPDPRQPLQQHTTADMNRARSIALKASDLAKGWAPVGPDTTPPCSIEPDESGLVQTGGIDRTFLAPDKSTTLGSRVAIFKSVGQAKRDWNLATLSVLGNCLLEQTRERYASKHVSVRLYGATALKPPTRGERSLHYRIVLLLSAKAQTLPVVTDIVGLGIGRISVLLRASTPAAPVPDTALHSLTGLLAKRLVAASGGI
jgi:hypothetical protein